MSIAIPELETVYDALAQAIDAVAPEKRELFLVKLALLAANEIENAAVFNALIAQAQVLED
jgi:hypothetical protein